MIEIIVVLSLLAILWIVQFAGLMLMDDECFPSKHDKVLWVIAFILVPIFVPLSFWAYKFGRKSMVKGMK